MVASSTLLARELERLERSAWRERVGVEAISARDGGAEVLLPCHEGNANSGGNLHGGATATAVLAAARLAAASTERQADSTIRTLSLAIAYLEAVRGGEVRAEARVVRRGRDTAHVIASVRGGSETVATAQVALGIEPRGGGGGRAGFAARPSAGALETARKGGARLAISPFLAGAGLEILSVEPPWVCGRMPLEGNQDAAGRMGEGMLAALVDFCGALASYAGGGIHRRRPGATVCLQVAFSREATDDVVGAGRLVGREGVAFTSAVELWEARSCSLCGAGQVSYRIPTAGAPL